VPGQWIGRRGAVEYPPRSPDLTPLDFYLWGTLKDMAYRRKPATLAGNGKKLKCRVQPSRGHLVDVAR
jgi:hypothetical protein